MGQLKGAIRPTIRDVRLHPWRSLAAIILIMVPVAISAFETVQSDSLKQFTAINSHAVTARFYGSTCEQNHEGSGFSCTNGYAKLGHRSDLEMPGADVTETISTTEMNEVLGSDFTVDTIVDAHGELRLGDRMVSQPITQISGSHLLPGAFELHANEIILDESTAQTLGAKVGSIITATIAPFNEQQISTETKQLELTVAAISPASGNQIVQPTLLSEDAIRNDFLVQFLIGGNRDITWDDVKKLNQLGLVVLAQNLQNHPKDIDVDQMYLRYRNALIAAQEQQTTTSSSAVLQIPQKALMFIFVFMLVTLALSVISPVFTIATSRQTKVYALMRTQGASKWHIRLAVLTYGTISGLIGATLGVVIGTIAGIAAWKLKYPIWPMNLGLNDSILAIPLITLLATGAAFLPAFLSSYGSIIAGAEGAQPDRIRRWHPWMAIGPSVFVFCAAIWIFESYFAWLNLYFGNTWVMLSIATLASLPGSVPALIFLSGKISRPLAARIAGRLVRRQAIRSVSIVTAILAASFITIGVTVTDNTETAASQTINANTFNTKMVSVSTYDTRFFTAESFPAAEFDQHKTDEPSAQLRTVAEQIKASTGATKMIPVYAIGDKDQNISIKLRDDCEHEYSSTGGTGYSYFYQGKDAAFDPVAAQHCYHLMKRYHRPIDNLAKDNDIYIGGPELLELFVMDQTAKEQATQVLEAGGVVGSSAIIGANPQQLVFTTTNYQDSDEGETMTNELTVPFAAALPMSLSMWIVSPEAAAKADLPVQFGGYALFADEEPSGATVRELQAVVDETSPGIKIASVRSSQRYNYQSTLILAGVLLLIITLVVVLSAEQIKRQNEQLYAIGADPSLIRMIGFFYGGITAALGTWSALFVGHLSAIWLLEKTETNITGQVLWSGSLDYYRVDWLSIGVLGILLPLISAGLGYAVTRSKTLIGYRQD